MIATPLLVAAFAMGFFGSPHCLGMCGGLVTAFGLSMKGISPFKKRTLIATYHIGRLLSYAFLGLVAAILGTTFLSPIMQGTILPRIFLGLVLVFIGLSMLGLPFLNKLEKVGMGVWKKLSPLRQKVFPIVTYPRALAAGLLWGFLPCGLVYGALLMPAVGNNIAFGALLMFVFGLGTVPMLVATHETVGWLHKQIGRFKLRKLNGLIMILSGLAVIIFPILMSQVGGHAHHTVDMDHTSLSSPTEHANSNEVNDDPDQHNMSTHHEAHEHATLDRDNMAESEVTSDDEVVKGNSGSLNSNSHNSNSH